MKQIGGGYKSTYEAAGIVGVSYNTILNWIKKGIFTNVIEKDGYSGRPQMYIPIDQVYVMKNARDGGRRRFSAYPALESEMPDDSELRMKKLQLIEDEIIKLEFAIGRLRVMIDQLKDLQ